MAQDPFNVRRHARLDAAHVEHEIRRFLAEDVGRGDVTSDRVVPKAARARAAMVARQACVVAGLPLAKRVFLTIDPEVVFTDRVSDGDRVAAGAVLAVIEGHAGPLLTGERVALNLVQRLSGIATLTRAYVDAIAGTGACVSDTRKTTPGLRVFEKYAVHVGGGRNHRMGLYDAILIKDNHRAIAGGAAAAVRAARQANGDAMPLQIEVDALADLPRVLELGVDAVLLDNMTPLQVAEAVRLARAHPRGRDCWIEASGGITLGSIRAYAEAGVDTISVGALTHSAPAVDIALDIASPDGVSEP
ncbi:MAG TPA: carboxylating nicotinate-nucleotide diphosphorylase [Vicinamibacterales bacterium]|nr:carboxylating nicotinate-nucleotide diphosphorylase [Vicinamibacterales bacterium]